MENRPIGVIDSGIGGLNVLKKLTIDFKNESFIYLGDNGNAPYGNKSKDYLFKRLKLLLECLNEKNVKCVVVACNTLSTTFKWFLEEYKVPTVLTIPKYEREGDYLLCTPLTAKSKCVKDNFNDSVLPLPMLAGEIERHLFEPEKIMIHKDLKGVPSSAKRLVLGCTHYLYLEEKIKEVSRLETENGLTYISNELKSVLTKNCLENTSGKQSLTFLGDHKNYNEKVYYKALKGF
ncbi:MAG: aspartate/glutamate racemase family protein [Clostridia bacterium]|nr:aspartate/glutamate racemase family protein [Clostridia bacterium]